MRLRRLLLAVLILIPSVALSARQDAAEKAYQAARRSYYALKDDAARRKLRHHWLSAAQRFEEVARSHPKSSRAPDALFTAAELLNELSRISRLDEDLKGAMDNYRKVAEGYPKHPLMDDSALSLARIYSDRIGNPEAALRVLERAALNGKGDRGNEMAALARSLAPSAPALAFGRPPAPKPARVAAKDAGREASTASRPSDRASASATKDAVSGAAATTRAAGPAVSEGAVHSTTASANDSARRDGSPTTASAKDGGPQDGSARTASAKDGATQDGSARTASARDGAPQDGTARTASAKDGTPQDGSATAAAAKDGASQDGSATAVAVKAGSGGAPSDAHLAAARDPAPHDVEVGSPVPTPVGSSRGVLDREALAEAFERAARPTSSRSTGSTQTASAVTRPAAPGIALRSSSGDEGASTRRDPLPQRSVPTKKEAQQLARSLPGTGETGVTLAEQLGLKVRRVVIDPGHGGHDSGAVGKKKVLEKDIALEVSLRVAEKLRAEGLEVLLTRTDDRFIRLEDRARFANESRGDLFISIHCNSAPNKKLRGIETYTLNTSADRYSIRLAARENASSEKGISDLQFILADLATKANTEESSRLATRVQKSLVGHMSSKYSGVKDLGTKEALFYVLLGVRMPAILVETSFLSHSEEGPRLATAAYQADLATAITDGVLGFLEHRGRLAQVQ